jgi:hypothetical protein
MTERLVFGSPEANRIAVEIKFLESVERCPNCGGFAELDRFSGHPSFDDDDGLPLPAGVYYRLGCPRCRIQGQWREGKSDAMLSWSQCIEIWWEINGERLNLDHPEEAVDP